MRGSWELGAKPRLLATLQEVFSVGRHWAGAVGSGQSFKMNAGNSPWPQQDKSLTDARHQVMESMVAQKASRQLFS